MHDRSAQILHALVREFIETGEPISSGWLFEHHNFGIKPAMIRFELSELTDQGFLEQPHHSAGRIPTDLGYQLFAEGALEQEALLSRDRLLKKYFFEQEWEALLERLSNDLGILGALCASTDREVYKEGLEKLIDRLDWESRDEVKEVIRDFEALDERVEKAADELEDNPAPRVFIGKQSPVTQSEKLSVMMHAYGTGENQVLLFAIGPKRMDYERIAQILKGLESNQ